MLICRLKLKNYYWSNNAQTHITRDMHEIPNINIRLVLHNLSSDDGLI